MDKIELSNDNENYHYRLTLKARYIVSGATTDQIKESIDSIRKDKGDVEADDLRKLCLMWYKHYNNQSQ